MIFNHKYHISTSESHDLIKCYIAFSTLFLAENCIYSASLLAAPGNQGPRRVHLCSSHGSADRGLSHRFQEGKAVEALSIIYSWS